ncbi:MAG: asparagine synthase (glutamine-hydrolyzing) [Planctomycetales bacterium]|nr:asparagine synthase (glutamine-hydrolyzing) [Planctomycetales bacterium]
MCGIAGYLLRRAGDAPPLARMVATLRHRGPDETRVREFGPAGIATARLQVIDLVTGSQPLANEDETVWVAFNGEIYNFAELRAGLEARHRFRSRSDTEVLVHLYEEHGISFLDRLNGMFAFALWDGSRGVLHLVRDRLGVKPLVYSEGPEAILFGSEIKAVLAGLPARPALDPAGIEAYLAALYVPAPATAFRGIRKLPPGHRAEVTASGIRLERWWRLPEPDPDPRPTLDEWGEEVWALLSDATRLRLVSDVPLGVLLSGGLDSSLVTAALREHRPGAIHTHSIGFPGAGPYDESSYARAAARHFGTEHHECPLTKPPDDAPGLVARAFDEPFADSSALATGPLCAHARRDVTVSLSGDGADEVFGGYTWLRDDERLRRRTRFVPRAAARAARALLRPRGPDPTRRDPLGRLLAYLSEPPGRAYARKTSAFGPEAREWLLRPDFLAEARAGDPEDFVESVARRVEGGRGEIGARLLRADTEVFLPEDILTKVDRMSMAHSLEVRSPFLDWRLVERAQRIPFHHKVSPGGLRKVVLRAAARGRVPPEALEDRKRGLSVPLPDWLRQPGGPLGLLEPGDARLYRLVRREAVSALLEADRSGGDDHSHRLWALCVLEAWLREAGR